MMAAGSSRPPCQVWGADLGECGSGSPSTAVRSRRGRYPTAASGSGSGCPTARAGGRSHPAPADSLEPGRHRRRSGDRPDRAPPHLDGEDDIDVVGEARDGEEAIAIIERTRPSIALLDVRMPGIDGLEVARRVLCTPHAAECRVIMLTT